MIRLTIDILIDWVSEMRSERSVAGIVGTLGFGVIALLGAVTGAAFGAEVKVLGSTGVRGILTELGAPFERATGHRLVVDYDVFAVLKRRIDGKQGKIAVETTATVGRSCMGAGCDQGRASGVLIRFLTSPAAEPVIKATGMEPG